MMNSKQSVQVCDATMLNSRTKAGNIKKILTAAATLIILFASCNLSFAQITVGANGIQPNNATDSNSTYLPQYGKGAWYTVADTAARNNITTQRRSIGMLVMCISDSSIYKLTGGTANSNWLKYYSPVSNTTASYCMQGSGNQISPADGETDYISANAQAAGTTVSANRIYLPKAGTIKRVAVYIQTGGTLGTNEASSMYIRLNNTTDYLIASTVDNSQTTQKISNTAMSIPIADNYTDYITLKWVCPLTWATNPTNVRITFSVWIE